MKTSMTKKIMGFFTMSALALVMGFSSPVFAALQSIGPLDTTTSFPSSITDTTGLSLAPCLNPFHCPAFIADLPFPDQPASFPGNHWGESFWFMGESQLSFASPKGGAGSGLLVMAIEGPLALKRCLTAIKWYFSGFVSERTG